MTPIRAHTGDGGDGAGGILGDIEAGDLIISGAGAGDIGTRPLVRERDRRKVIQDPPFQLRKN